MNNTITLPGGITLTLPQFGPQQGQQLSLPNLSLPNLQLPNLPQGTPPDLSALLPVLMPILSAAVPGIGPFLPIIGALLHILYSLTTQVHAATTSGTPNPSLQMVHDAAWQQVLGAFGQKQIAPPAPAAA